MNIHAVTPEEQKVISEYCTWQSERVMASVTPANFSWVAVDQLAGMACPTMTAHYQYLLDNGIKHLVCLCESKPPNCESCPALVLHHINVTDFCPPRPEQIDGFLAIVERANAKGEGVGVHCMHGLGRTGTMLACFLVRTRALDGRRAIDEIRRLRPGSIETTEQETSVHDFYQRHLQVPAGKNTV